MARVTMSVIFDDGEREGLEALAIRSGLDAGEVLREMLRSVLAKQPPKANELEQARKRLDRRRERRARRREAAAPAASGPRKRGARRTRTESEGISLDVGEGGRRGRP